MKILSIDGGGIRGIIPGIILAELEKRIISRTNKTDARISDYFDLIAGTSTGGILSCILICPDQNGRPKFTAQQAVDLYLKKGGDIFSLPFWQKIKSADGILDEKYPSAGLENALKQYFGDTKLSQVLKPCLITSYDILNRRSVFFDKKDAIDDYNDFYLRDIARATSAAPTYFEVADTHSVFGTPYPLIDGGVFANNPAMCALVESTKMNTSINLSEVFLLSLGTGKDRNKKNSYTYNEAKKWGVAHWVVPLIDILMSANSETVDYQLRKIFENTRNTDGYIRVQPDLINAEATMDNASSKNMEALKQDAGQFIADHEDMINKIVDRLV